MLFICVRLVVFTVMSLSGYDNSTGAPPYQGLTRSGVYASPVTAACGPSYPFGTRFWLPWGEVRVCQDRGPAVSDHHLDLWFPTYAQAWEFGRQEAKVGVIQRSCVASPP